MYFLIRQGGFDENSHSYLRKIQRSISEKDEELNERIKLKQFLSQKDHNFVDKVNNVPSTKSSFY